MKKMLNENLLFSLFALLVVYLLINTGTFADDYFANIVRYNKSSFINALIPSGNVLNTPIAQYTHGIWFYFCKYNNAIILDVLKIFYIILSLYLISKFFNLYMSKREALLVSFLFLLYPSHDSIAYWFPLTGHVFAFALFFYSFYLARYDKLIPAFMLALFASFISYGSTPIAISLFVLFILNREIKKGMVILLPNIIFSLYFIFLSVILRLTPSRLLEKVDLGSFIKQFLLQISTFIDAMIGPSMWLKIYYSFSQLSITSWIIGILLAIIFYLVYREKKSQVNLKLLASLAVLAISSFAMFAATGRYPQLAFNFGNRTTLWGSLLFAYLIVVSIHSRLLRSALLTIMVFAIFGISDHWKQCSLWEQEVIKKIENNESLKNYSETDTLYVSGSQYSKYGPISHIEFMSEDCVPGPLFPMLFEKISAARTLNKRHRYEDGYLIDTKYNTKDRVGTYINIYDSEKDSFFKLNVNKVNNYTESLPLENRHWVTLEDNKITRFIKNIATALMPRLKYAFGKI